MGLSRKNSEKVRKSLEGLSERVKKYEGKRNIKNELTKKWIEANKNGTFPPEKRRIIYPSLLKFPD